MKKIALIAHDNKKTDMVEWAEWNISVLEKLSLVATGSTGKLIEKSFLEKQLYDYDLEIVEHGPMGGDFQIGSKIVNGEVGALIFFYDPLDVMPHDVDVKALLRIAMVYNIPTACNKRTADMLISSSLFDEYIMED